MNEQELYEDDLKELGDKEAFEDAQAEIYKDPMYEPDGECACDGVEPEWDWFPEEGCYICVGCGTVC